MIRAAILYMLAMLATAGTGSVEAAVAPLLVGGFASIIFSPPATARSRSSPTAPLALLVGAAACGAAAIAGGLVLAHARGRDALNSLVPDGNVTA